MFLRQKRSGSRVYLQIVENRWEGGGVKQRVIATLGRLDELQAAGGIEALMRSAVRFCEGLLVIEAQARGEAPVVACRCIGPGLVFERLWQEVGLRAVLTDLLAQRHFEFPVERAVYLTVLHRLFEPGSDRAAERWRTGYALSGTEALEPHHLYRAMAWLGEALPEAEQGGRTPFAPRCTKDLRGAVCPPPGSLQHARPGVLRYHLPLLRGGGR